MREVLNHLSDQNIIDRERCDVILVFDKLIGDRFDAVSSTTLRYFSFS